MTDTPCARLSTGVAGLDEVLHGGLIPGRVYLVRGAPGVGKTTLGLHFLTAGAAGGERALYMTLADPEEKIRANARSMGFSLDGIDFLDLSTRSTFFSEARSYDIFSPAEVERDPVTRRIIETMADVKPRRVVVDPTSQLRYLTPDPFQFRRQMGGFLRFLEESGVTVLWTSEVSAAMPDDDLQFMSDGVILVEFAPGGWAISVAYLGSGYQLGQHSAELSEKGMEVFPRLVPETHRRDFPVGHIASGITELDSMLCGGLEHGTITIITGPAGVGKTTIGLHFMTEAASRGERSAVYTFEEETNIMLRRCDGIGLPVRAAIERGELSVVKIEPLRFTPDAFAQAVRREVEQKKTRIVMLDNISGYSLCLRGGDLTAQLHALGKYLQNMGVAVLLINEVESIIGDFRATEVGISYMADNIVFLRYFESEGTLRRAIGVLKMRASDYEKALRELRITSDGVKLGEPLSGLRGILRGVPEYDPTAGP